MVDKKRTVCGSIPVFRGGKDRRNQRGEKDEGRTKEIRGKSGETLETISRSNSGYMLLKH